MAPQSDMILQENEGLPCEEKKQELHEDEDEDENENEMEADPQATLFDEKVETTEPAEAEAETEAEPTTTPTTTETVEQQQGGNHSMITFDETSIQRSQSKTQLGQETESVESAIESAIDDEAPASPLVVDTNSTACLEPEGATPIVRENASRRFSADMLQKVLADAGEELDTSNTEAATSASTVTETQTTTLVDKTVEDDIFIPHLERTGTMDQDENDASGETTTTTAATTATATRKKPKEPPGSPAKRRRSQEPEQEQVQEREQRAAAIDETNGDEEQSSLIHREPSGTPTSPVRSDKDSTDRIINNNNDGDDDDDDDGKEPTTLALNHTQTQTETCIDPGTTSERQPRSQSTPSRQKQRLVDSEQKTSTSTNTYSNTSTSTANQNQNHILSSNSSQAAHPPSDSSHRLTPISVSPDFFLDDHHHHHDSNSNLNLTPIPHLPPLIVPRMGSEASYDIHNNNNNNTSSSMPMPTSTSTSTLPPDRDFAADCGGMKPRVACPCCTVCCRINNTSGGGSKMEPQLGECGGW
mmetsp:Transcript_24609/g.58196  ORF Transcript_24609/g.58196 Transcript_24609/m.58196 type:complete len:530 (-) Transcript_24609:216-1805(-)